jgi:hypothetical protein
MDQHHDASSAIVNSAVIHHPDETSIVDAIEIQDNNQWKCYD